MQKNSQNFSPEDAQRIANTPAAQQLLALLRRTDPAALSQAMAHASAGDYLQAKEALADLLSDGNVNALLKQLGGAEDG